MSKEEYAEKLKHPKWQKMRLKILERDKWKCKLCGDTETTLHVHHKYYKKDNEPWDYPEDSLITLCEGCHQEETYDRPEIEKQLLKTLKKHFLLDDLKFIANAFRDFNPTVPTQIIAEAIAMFLMVETAQDLIISLLFLHGTNTYKETSEENKTFFKERSFKILTQLFPWLEIQIKAVT